MKHVKRLILISLALATAYSPIGCVGRRKALQNNDPTMPVVSSVVTERDKGKGSDSPTSDPAKQEDTVTDMAESSTEPTSEPAEDVAESSSIEDSFEFSTENDFDPSNEEDATQPSSLAESSVDPTSTSDSATSTEAGTTSATEPTVPSSAPTETSKAFCEEHDYVYGVLVEPTCTKEGVMTLTCKVCGYVYQGPIEKTAHSWDNGTVTTPATCSKDGIKTFTCSGCKATRTEAIPSTGEHNYVATKTVFQTKIGTMDDLGYTLYTCSGCGATVKSDYEGYLDCAWRYSAVNAYRTGAGRFLRTEDGGIVRYNEPGCTYLDPFTRSDGLESIAKLRAKQEAYDMYNSGRLDHSHDGLPYSYFYGNAFWGGFNCECCQGGGVEFHEDLDATFSNEEAMPYERQGHLQIEFTPILKYLGIGAYVYKGRIAVVCEYSDLPN